MQTERNRESRFDWTCALALNSAREVVSGSPEILCDAIRRAADLRIYTEFRHNEHIDTDSDNPELVREVSAFQVTYLLEDRWAAGIMVGRQPVGLPSVGFGARASMSFFLYNQDGRQAVARPFLDGGPVTARPGPSPVDDHSRMPKYHQEDAWDQGTNAPSQNFIYDFESYRYCVREAWREVLACTAEGEVASGSLASLAEAFAAGCDVKVGILDLCRDLAVGATLPHEVFVQTGWSYHYTARGLFIAATLPVVRIRPSIPLVYVSRGWDFAWLIARTDGTVSQLIYDPYTLSPRRATSRHAIRWFIGP